MPHWLAFLKLTRMEKYLLYLRHTSQSIRNPVVSTVPAMNWILWSFFSLAFVQFLSPGCVGCPQEERLALLEIRQSFYPDESTSPPPPSWVSGDGDCCLWENVVCDNKTRRVSKLFLSSTSISAGENPYLNASLFLPFRELVFLNLSSNGITGMAEADDDGFQRFSRLNKLEFLDLSNNSFDDSVLPLVGAFSSLKTLSLAANLLAGSTHFQELAALHKLEELDLSGNRLESFFAVTGLRNLSKLEVLNLNSNEFNMSTLRSLGHLTSLKKLYIRENNLTGSIEPEELNSLRGLEVLDLSSNNISGSFLEDIERIPSLRALSLHGNGINASEQVQGFCKLKKLEELDISDNKFEGMLPSCLGNLTSLRVLDLSKNRFSGNISSSFINSLALSLEFLSLSHNLFNSLAPFSSFANHSKLVVFELVNDLRGLVIETESTGWVPPFQFKIFRLSNCSIHKSSIPDLLSHQHELRVIDLSHNHLMGEFPTWLIENNTRLEELHLQNNSFTGQFPVPSRPISFISLIDISDNQFRGPIPSNIGVFLPNLKFFNASKNSFDGSIPSSFGNMRSLILLDLSNNSFTGEIPQHLALGCFSLRVLKLSNNNLSGQMFPRFSNLTSLKLLFLDGNGFLGELPYSLSNSSELERLNIGRNFISGKLPGWIGNMTSLEVLSMPRNNLEGTVPTEFCSLEGLKFIDLSQNNLSGTTPSCFSPPWLLHAHFQENMLTGTIPRSFSNCLVLVTLDMRHNHLTGGIPSWISELSDLSILLLGGNHLEGKIPNQLCNLSKMTLLDLSHNNLSGSIPSCLNKIPFKIGFQSEKFVTTTYIFSSEGFSPYSYKGELIELTGVTEDKYPVTQDKYTIEFVTKYNSRSFMGNILYLMKGIDLSSNKLTGKIPPELGEISRIQALNLSRNDLTGQIPANFSGLKNLESLDLSYNNLTGPIPPQLAEVTTLGVFSVAHNNLSGRIPEKAQFGAFPDDSYKGNPFLCGALIRKSCSTTEEEAPRESSSSGEGKDSFMDMEAFYVSFGVSYVMVLLTLAACLYINPNWRSKWLHLAGACITSCHGAILHFACKAQLGSKQLRHFTWSKG